MNIGTQRKLGAALSYVSIIANTLVQLLYTPILIRMLGQNEYGLYSLIASTIGYLSVLDLGFGNAIVVYTSKYRAQNRYDDEKKLHGMFKIIFSIIGVIVGLLGIILFLNINKIFGHTMSVEELHKARILMLILTFNLTITFQFSVYSSIIRAYERFTYQKVIAILSTIIKPLIMLPLLFMGYKSITMSIVITCVNIFVLLSNYLFCKSKLGVKIKCCGIDKQLFSEIFNYSFFIFLAVLVDKANWSVDNFILGAVSGTIAVSIYSVASHLNGMFVNLSTAISGVMLPKISSMVAKNASNEIITDEFVKIGRLQYFIIFLMASGLVLFGKEFIIAWVGEQFQIAYYIALILILPLCVPLIQNLGVSIMQAKNLHKFRSILLFCIAIVNVFISIPLAKNYGGIGAAIGTSLALIVGNIIIINIYYYRKVGIDIIKFWKAIFKMTIPFIIPITFILIAMNFIELHGYYNLIVFGGIYTIIYSFICYFFVMNEYEKNFVNKILIKLHIKRG